MKKILLTFLLLNTKVLIAQSQFERIVRGNMDDVGASLQSTSTGDYLISGSTLSYSTDRRGMIIKTNSAGSISWAKTYNLGTFFKLTQAFELLDGNYMFSGTVLDSIHPEGDMLLMKTDTSGAILWSKLYGTSGPDYIPALHAIVQLPDSGFAFVGGSDLNFNTREDIAIVRTDKNGDTLWTKFYHATYRDQASSIAATADGGFIISGRANSFNTFIMDIFLMKIDSVGNIEWTRQYGGPAWEEGTGAVQTTDGGYAVCGSERSFSVSGDYDGLVFKTDSIGTVEWTTAIGDSLEDALYSIIQSNDGGLVCVGITTSFFNHQQRSSVSLDSDTTDIFLFKLSALGDTVWSNVYGGDKIEEAYSVHQHADNGFMMAGLTYSYGSNNLMDMIIIKTDSVGASCSASPITPILYHPTLVSDTISFLELTPLAYRNYLPIVTDVTVNDSVLCYQYTSIENLANNKYYTASPNPFSCSFKIKTDVSEGLKNCTYKIIDVLGREVTDQFYFNSTSNSAEFSRKTILKTGVYMLVVSDGNKVAQTVKVIAQ